jgi:hypothetical protein
MALCHTLPADGWAYAAATGGIVNTTTAVTIAAAPSNSQRNYLTSLQIATDTLGAATELAIRDGAGGTVLWRGKLQTGPLPLTTILLGSAIRSSQGTLLEILTLTAVTGGVFVNAQGYVGT